MIQFHEALELIFSNSKTLPEEKVDLMEANNRVLAREVSYDMDIPPFNKSAMDGFACRREDISGELKIVETVYAGMQPEKKIRKNECARIMTGAVIPEGADMVFIKEESELLEEKRVICTGRALLENICYVGEDVRAGDIALRKGTLITSKNIPILAGAGESKPLVYRQPEVTIFSTGTELVEPAEKPLPFQIRNSNSYQMMAQLENMGIRPTYSGIIVDDEEETRMKISSAMERSELILLSGGVSMGDSDFIPAIIKDLGFEILLTESAIQPGKPILFAKKGDVWCFGLAGNPVSSYVQTELYVKHFIYRLMGYESQLQVQRSMLGKDFTRKRTDRLKFVPAILDNENIAHPVEFHGSAHIDAFSRVNCLVEIPIGVSIVKKGDKVNVRPV